MSIDIDAALRLRELAADMRDTDQASPPGAPREGAPDHIDNIVQGLLEAGTAQAVINRLNADNRALTAAWIAAALREGSLDKTEIARLAGVSRQTVHNIAGEQA